jgi:DNA-binding transcriptional MerR regulator
VEGTQVSDDTVDAMVRPRTKKAPNAFRTISEVADDLHIPQHVLRFWETKFIQVKPLKRGGGRRYYRPDDIGLLRRIADLLYTQGYTIKGVQRLLREGGGQLSDDIPPPHDEERAAEGALDDAEDDDTPLIPGLDLLSHEQSALERLAQDEGGAEAERLRTVLQDVLRELESLRQMLARCA